MAPNGTDIHTIDFETEIPTDGSAFDSIPGRLQVLEVYGGVTTDTPSGWTLHEEGDAIANGALYVFWRVSDGASIITLQHNASNYPLHVALYEYESGSEYIGGDANTSITYDGPSPSVSGLSGDTVVKSIKGRLVTNNDEFGMSWSANVGVPTKDYDVTVRAQDVDGYNVSSAYDLHFSGSIWSPVGVSLEPSGVFESVTYAVLSVTPDPETDPETDPAPETEKLQTPVVTVTNVEDAAEIGGLGTVQGTITNRDSRATRFDLGITTDLSQTSDFEIIEVGVGTNFTLSKPSGDYKLAVIARAESE